MKLVSVIIPVYKVEHYLRECVESVLASTYSNLEIILVDDGSPDNSPRICDEFEKKDSRVKVVHQVNAGLCAARNAGLRMATGEYVAFVDSDDIVSSHLYQKMVDTIEATKADWVACEFTRTQDSLSSTINLAHGDICILEGFEQQLAVLVNAPSIRTITWSSGYVWNKLYRRDLITKPFLSNCFHSEDLQFNWDYLHNCKKIAILPCALYYYRINEDSITETYRRSEAHKIVERSLSLAQIFEGIAEHNPQEASLLTPYLRSRAVNVMHGSLFRMSSHGITKHNRFFCKHARAYICRHWFTMWNEKETYSLHARLSVVIFVFAYPLWCLFTKLW